MPKRKSAGFDLKPYVIILGIIGLILTFYIGYRASITERKLFSTSLIALFAGLLFESFRISDNWKHVVYRFIGTYLFSMICFLPGKNEGVYILEDHIQAWPYYFIVIFSLFTAIFYKNQVTAKLTEGITLIQSVSLIYWTLDYGFFNIDNWFAKSLLVIALSFSAFTIIHALTYIKLSRTVRLTLSIWSTIIMVIFAVDNIFRVFQNEDLIAAQSITEGCYIGLQYFLLGVSAIYITQNYMLLANFLPSKNGNRKKDLQEIKKDHINRYSEDQVMIGHSILCILFTSGVFWLNHYFQILPRHTMIWLVVVTFPLVLRLLGFTNRNL